MTEFNQDGQQFVEISAYKKGTAHRKSDISRLFDLLFGSFLEDEHYKDTDIRMMMFDKLIGNAIEDNGPEFVAKLAMFTHNELGMHFASQYIAAKLNDQQFYGKRAFYHSFCHCLDDVSGVMAIVESKLHQKRSHALVRGFGDYLRGLNDYAFAAYETTDKKYNVYDLVNITHANSPSINRLMRGKLAYARAWDNDTTSIESCDKNFKWIEMVDNWKLYYVDLVLNLNNILDAASNEGLAQSWVEDTLVPQIMNAEAIRAQRVYPYKIFAAYKNLRAENAAVVSALEHAFIVATNNMPRLVGSTGIIVDVTSGVELPISKHSNISVHEAFACYAVALFLRNPKCQLIRFGNTAQVISFNDSSSPFSLIQELTENNRRWYSTNFEAAFGKLSKHDRVFIFSDRQCCAEMYTENSERPIKPCIVDYFKSVPRPHIYTFNLDPRSIVPFNPTFNNVHPITSLNDKLFAYLELFETGEHFLCGFIDGRYNLD